MTDGRAALLDLAGRLNELARSTIERDGEHAAMFFLRLPDDRIRQQLFEDVDRRPVGEVRARQLAAAVSATGADAVAIVSEAWSAAPEEIPRGGGAGDSPDAMDVLLVAALDRDGNLVAFETSIRRGADGAIELGESSALDGYRVNLSDGVRDAWLTMPAIEAQRPRVGGIRSLLAKFGRRN